MFKFIGFLVLFGALPLLGTDEKILLPLYPREVIAGLNGSLWKAQLSMLNHGSVPLSVRTRDEVCPIPCPSLMVLPDITYTDPEASLSRTIPANFVYITQSFGHHLQLELRVFELSRNANWGFEVPVVRESNAFQTKVNLLNIPAGTAFRTTLRIYDFDPSLDRPSAVTVRLYAVQPGKRLAPQEDPPMDRLLRTFTATFAVASDASTGGPRYHPGFIEVHGLSQNTEMQQGEELRIEIEPGTPGLRFWAFASITNNETQQVTTVAP